MKDPKMATRWQVAFAFWALLSTTRGETNLPPAFIEDMDNLPLSESTPLGEVVYTLKGRDPEGQPIKYGLVGTDRFSVNPDTGEITLVKPLDREINDTMKFLVSIEDQVPGGQNNLVRVPFTIIVLDENDNAPYFKNSPYEVDVPEDAKRGTTVLGDISVEDKDSVGDNLEVGCIDTPQWADACETFEVVTLVSSADQFKGALVLRRPLDYNDKQFYQFKLYASDGRQNSTAHVEVKVEDVQNSPPVFSGSMAAALAEDAPVGSLVTTIRARDADRAHPRTIHYDLITNPLDFFVLDSSTGELKTAKPLDREALADPFSPLNLTIRAREIVNGQPVTSESTMTTATLTVTIKDVNDEPPRFNQPEYSVEIPESLPVGTPIPNLDMMVTDTDLGLNAVFGLRLSDEWGAFVVEPAKAAGSAAVTLRLNNTLDFEDPNRRKFILVVIAEELHTEPRLSSKAIVTVTVTDVNDNAPKFAEEVYSAVVSEDAVPGTRITTITATDRDQGRYGSDGIVYHLSGNGAELFRLDNRTGDVSVAPCPTPGQAPCLDIETRRDYLLHYKATDEDGAGQTTVVSLQITLMDANDNPPACATAAYRAAIDEDATKFEPELQVHARDVDQTSEIRYSIVDPEDSAFWIDPFTGKVGVKMDTNVEMGSDYNNHIMLTVLATDGVHNATCTVDIAIRDVNNHAPVFDAEHYNATVLEDAPIGTEVAQVLASDMDSGINAEIKYSIEKGALDAFMVDNETGVVTLYSKLDYDKRNTYRINILASDKGMPSLTGTTELTVQVINVNDKLPYFTPQIQRAEVSADAEIDTIVHILIAMDPDVTNSEELIYELSSTKLVKAVDKNGKEVTDEGIFNNWFSVWPNGSVVVSRRPDRTRAAVLTLPVVVIDTSATTLQQADGELIITVVDVNRHAPIFPQSQYFERLPEEQPVGTVLGTYMATDKETPIAYYEIRPPNAYFHIDNVTGIVKSSQRIDYEKIRRIDFNVVAYDSGVPQLYGTANILVEILNINDEEPVFDNSSYEAKVLENSKEGTLVLTVHASDADEGQYGEVRYNLLGEYAPLFTIDSVSGDVRVARGANIDREAMSELWLQATATDNAPDDMRRMTRVMVHVVIEDVNDNSPVFTQNVYKSTIAENLRLEPPAVILQVLAEDKDIGVNGQIKYEIVEQSVPDTFTVDEMTGIIYPSKSVVGNTTYHLTVTATDQAGEGSGAHMDVAKVDIYVASVNKHKPVFVVPSTPQHIIEIPENAAQADLLVLTVKATDEDTGENGRISYHLKVDNENVQETQEFTIDEQSGELRTKTFLDREHNPSYQLVVVARDNGSPGQFEALVFLTVLVQDTNDNVPRFAKEFYYFAISENQPAGIIIGSLKAQDKDAGDNGKVYYHILSGNEDGAFILDRTQGFVRANISFDREKRSKYTMTVYASNDPIVERPLDILEAAQHRQDNATNLEYDRSIADVFVTVLDENDNEPKFQKKIYYAGVKNTARLNEPVIAVTARDDDLDENGTLTYLVAASNLYKFGDRKSSGSIVPSPFNITQDGVVTTANFMSEYNQDRFVLEVLAQEVAPPHRRAVAHVHVWIISGAQTLRMVLSRACSIAERARAELERRVSAATGAIVIAHALRQHVRDGRIHEHWCEVELHAVETGSQEALAAESALALVDARYDQLRDLYRDVGVETVVAAASPNRVREEFDPALATLIALLIVLFTGVVTFIVVCACLRHWVVSPPSMESSKGDSLARRRILDELSTTENPLWLENKLRPYEEQELTMNVFGEQSAENASENVEQPQVDNPYATIQGSGTTERCGEYATLGRGSPTPLEAALGFQGSTFKPPTPETPEPPPRPSAGLALVP